MLPIYTSDVTLLYFVLPPAIHEALRLLAREEGEKRGGGKGGPLSVSLFSRKEKERRARKTTLFLFPLFWSFFSLFFFLLVLTMADLADFIAFSSVEALNENPEHTFQNALKKVRNVPDLFLRRATRSFEQAIDRWLSLETGPSRTASTSSTE